MSFVKQAMSSEESTLKEPALQNEFPCIIIDSGSARIKAGFSGDDAPAVEFPSLLRYAGKYTYVGDEATSKRG